MMARHPPHRPTRPKQSRAITSPIAWSP